MRTSTLFSMNRSAVLFIALFLVVGAFGASVTYYTDNNCGTKATSPFLGVPNPLVAPLNTCVKAMEEGGTTLYVKFSVCSSSSFAVDSYSDSGCILADGTSLGGTPGGCITTNPPPGSQSFKIDCSNATSPPSTTTAKSPPSTTVKSAAPNPASLMALILAFAFAAICAQV
jgi:hypothetical protein